MERQITNNLPSILRNIYNIAHRNTLLPKCYGNWHSIYMRFQRGNERGLWWKILVSLQKEKKSKNECCHLVLLNIIVMVVVKKGETIQGQKYLRLNNKITFGYNIRLSNSRRIFEWW